MLRGSWPGVEYPLYEGANYVGRSGEKPVDVDLTIQEPPDRVWCSQMHALVTCEGGRVLIEDLNTANGTFVNRNRILPSQTEELKPNDVIQIGDLQMQVLLK